jgi:hypothetical protein
MAYIGTIPPWNNPNSDEMTNSETKPSKKRYSKSANP